MTEASGSEASGFPPLWRLRDGELERATPLPFLKVVYNAVARLFHDRVGIILASAFVLILIWGQHGKVQLLGQLWDGWDPTAENPKQRDEVIPGIPWDQEWLSFLVGFLVLVVVPALIIKLIFKQRLADYGLGLPPRTRLRFALLSAVLLFAIGLVVFLSSAGKEEMRAEYPLYRGPFDSNLDFAVYELGYFLFFVVIEFVFRGYLLFGLYQVRDRDAPPGVGGAPGPLVFGYYAVLISMLSYTAWHLGKPLDETWGTIVWGLVAAPVVLESRSIVLIIVVHWLLNVALDLAIWQGWSFSL